MRPDSDELIPFMATDDGLFFTETVDDPSEDRPVWAWWDGRHHEDSKVADSFASFLTQLADGLRNEDIIVNTESRKVLTYWDEIYGQLSKDEARAQFPNDFVEVPQRVVQPFPKPIGALALHLDAVAQNQVNEVVGQYEAALEASGLEWDPARIFVEYITEPHPAELWGCRSKHGDELAGIAVTESLKSAMEALHPLVEASIGSELKRLRVEIHRGVDGGTVFYSTTPSGEMRVGWGWGDEKEAGSAAQGASETHTEWRVIDEARYTPCPSPIASPEVSIAQITAWARQHAPGYVTHFNEPATEARIAEVESLLGAILPKSVREAYRVHNGQPIGAANLLVNSWISLDDLAEESKLLSERSDARPRLPIMKTDGIVFFVEGVSDPEGESPVWLWEYGTEQDERVADSFGAYLAQLAQKMDQSEVAVDEDSGILYYDD